MGPRRIQNEKYTYERPHNAKNEPKSRKQLEQALILAKAQVCISQKLSLQRRFNAQATFFALYHLAVPTKMHL